MNVAAVSRLPSNLKQNWILRCRSEWRMFINQNIFILSVSEESKRFLKLNVIYYSRLLFFV